MQNFYAFCRWLTRTKESNALQKEFPFRNWVRNIAQSFPVGSSSYGANSRTKADGLDVRLFFS